MVVAGGAATRGLALLHRFTQGAIWGIFSFDQWGV
jgi:glucose-6-phosphate isomerase